MKKKKGKEHVKISLIGSMSTGVTGSCYKIKFMGKTYMIDLGLYQEKSMTHNYYVNSGMKNLIKKESIEAVILTHSHIDHIGLVPVLAQNSLFSGYIYASCGTAMLAKPLLLDSAHIMEFEAKFINGGVKPLYEASHVYSILDKIIGCEVNKVIPINNEVSFKFLRNPHIVGSAQIEMYFKAPSNITKKVLITGDIGNLKFDKPYVDKMDYCRGANIMFLESTYGRNNKLITSDDREKDIAEIKKLVQEFIIDGKGRILIPVFSQDRLQVILTVFYMLYKDDINFKSSIDVDSSLGIDINDTYLKILYGDDLELFKKILSWDKVNFLKQKEASNLSVDDQTPRIILSTSGFGNAGRITNYFSKILPDENNCVLFCGYSSPNSTSGKIRDINTESVKIGKSTIEKKCTIKELKSFSSHIQQDDLIEYMERINCSKIYLVHGDSDSKNDLKEKAIQELREFGKTTTVICSEKNMEIVV